jgi:hypothetical protein
LLSDYDSYYYSRGGQGPLPVLRVKFSVLLLGGLGSSVLGLYLGVKRLIRDLTPSRDPQALRYE